MATGKTIVREHTRRSGLPIARIGKVTAVRLTKYLDRKERFQMFQGDKYDRLIHPPGCRSPFSFWGIAWIVIFFGGFLVAIYLLSPG